MGIGFRRRFCAAFFLLSVGWALRSAATTYTWTGNGGDDLWSDGVNWSPTAAPFSSRDTSLLFTGTKHLSNTQDISSSFQLNTLMFDSTAGAFVIGGNTLEFITSSGNTAPSIVQNSANGEVLSTPIQMDNDLAITGSGAGGLTLTGTLSGAGGLNVYHDTILNSGPMSAASSIDHLAVNAGSVEFAVGTLNLSATGSTGFNGNSSLFVEANSLLTVNNGATLNTVGTPQIHNNGQLVVNNATWSNTGTGNEIRVGYAGGTSKLTIQNNATVTTGGLRLGNSSFTQNVGHGALDIRAATATVTTLTLDDASAVITLDVASKFNVGAFNELTSGTVINFIEGGELSVGAGDLSSTFGGQLQVANVNIYTGVLTKVGTGTLTLTGASTDFRGTVNLDDGSIGIGNNAAFGGATISANGGALFASGADRTLGNNITAATNKALLVTAPTGDVHNLTLSGTISGAGGLTLNAPGTTLTLTGSTANTYTGLTSVVAGTLDLAKNKVVALSGNLSIGNATNPGSAGAATVEFSQGNPFAQTTNVTIYSDGLLNTLNGGLGTIGVANLTMTGGQVVTFGGSLDVHGDVTTNASSTSAVISGSTSTDFSMLDGHAFNVADGTATYDLDISAGITSSGTVLKTGAGTLRLSAHNLLNTLAVNAGTLAIANDSAVENLTLAGGTLIADSGDRSLNIPVTVTANSTIGSSVDGTPRSIEFSNSVSLSANATLAVRNNATTTFSGVISGAGGLLKAGNGTMALTNNNTFTGGLTIDGGTVQATSDASLGDATNIITVNGGTLAYQHSAVTNRTFDMTAGTITVPNSSAIIYGNGAAVNGGFLSGAGTHSFADGSSLSGTTAAIGSTVTTNGTVNFSNATLRGSVTQIGGTLNVSDTVVSSAGTLTASAGTMNTTGLENDGVLTINNGATVANSGTSLVLGGGSRTNIGDVAAPGGTLSTSQTTSIEMNGALLVNNGTQTGRLNINYGSTAKGAGTFGDVHVNDGGKFSPGNSPASVTVSSLSLNSGGTFVFELNSAHATPGNGADFVNDLGLLSIGATPNSPFTIQLVSLNNSNQAGGLSDFDATQSYQFTLATAAGGISNFTPGAFVVDTSSFANNLAGGSFFVSQNGNDLTVNFAPVPEPSTWGMIVLGAGLLVVANRFRRRAS